MFIGTLGVVMDVYWNIGSSHGCLLEHWKSYGAKIMMRGLVIRKLCVGRSTKRANS